MFPNEQLGLPQALLFLPPFQRNLAERLTQLQRVALTALAPTLANLSAFSFPMTPECQRTHRRLTEFALKSHFSYSQVQRREAQKDFSGRKRSRPHASQQHPLNLIQSLFGPLQLTMWPLYSGPIYQSCTQNSRVQPSDLIRP